MMPGTIIASTPVASTPAGGTLLPQTATVWINGVNVTEPLWTGAAATPIVQVSEVVGGASTATLVLVEEDAPFGTALDIQVGQEVIIEHRTRRIFGGSIVDVSVDAPEFGPAVFHRLSCKDYSFELEKKRVAQSYEDTGDPVTQTAGDVFSQIFADFLSDSGLMLGEVEDGPLIQKVNFNYVRASDAYQQLANLTSGGFIWRVDSHKVLSFRARTAIPAPWSVDDIGTDIHQGPGVSRSLEHYRNRQIVRGGTAETEPRTDEFEADGKLRTFTLRLPLAAKPVIRVDAVAVDPAAIGIKGVDEDTAGITWLFEIRDPDVVAKTAPTAGADIEVDYIGLFPIVVIRENAGEQTARAAIEIGDGVYEEIEVDEDLDLPTARQYGDALIEKHARIPERIEFTTDRQGELHAGQLLPVELTQLGIDADFLIETVELSLVGDDLRYGVAANDGRETLEWLEFYRRIQRPPFLVRDNEKLILANLITDQIELDDTVLVELTDERIPWDEDEYTAFLVGLPIGHFLVNGEADGPHILTADIV
jgi:hypothetical protein